MFKNVTLSAEESKIAAARKRAVNDNTTLNAKFREWLDEYTSCDNKEGEERVRKYREMMKRLNYVKIGRKFSRDEMNARR